jgi:hypothetical protein
MSAVSKPRAPVREEVRAPVREEVRLKPGQVRGRDGEILTRNKNFDNAYEIPDHLKEPGWSYQRNRVTCFGEPDSLELSRMMDNGWRYVKPSSRIGQIYGMKADADFIEIGGLVLMERPQELTDQALEENAQKTEAQYNMLMDRSSDLKVPVGFRESSKKVTRGERVVVDDGAIPND